MQPDFSPYVWLAGAGPDGVEEIKQHRFFAPVDWNVSTFKCLLYFFVTPWNVTTMEITDIALCPVCVAVVQKGNKTSVQTDSRKARGHLPLWPRVHLQNPHWYVGCGLYVVYVLWVFWYHMFDTHKDTALIAVPTVAIGVQRRMQARSVYLRPYPVNFMILIYPAYI
jgi:hypothetical protein